MKTYCYEQVKTALFGRDFIDDLTNDTVKKYRQECNCLPACTSIKYEAAIDRTKFDYEELLDAVATIVDKNLTYENFSSFEF